MPERMEQADRERLNDARAYMLWFNDPDACVDSLGPWYERLCNANRGSGRTISSFSESEIARLEALEHAEANAFNVTPDPGWDAHKLTTWTGDSLVMEYGLGVQPPATLSWTVRRGKAPPIVFHPSALAALEADMAEPAAPTEQRLDDFMREQERKRRREYLAEAWPMNEEPEDHDEPQPASRELVERMVREATSHSLWPVEVKVYDDCVEAWARVPKNDLRLIASASLPIKTMEHMTFCRSHITGWTDKMNRRACPACNGSAKVRGYFFGEKQCPDCEGTGVR